MVTDGERHASMSRVSRAGGRHGLEEKYGQTLAAYLREMERLGLPFAHKAFTTNGFVSLMGLKSPSECVRSMGNLGLVPGLFGGCWA